MAGGQNSQSDLLVANREVTGALAILGSNVVIRNTKINGRLSIRGGTNILVENVRTPGMVISGATNVTVRNSNVGGAAGEDDLHINVYNGRLATNVVLEGNYIGRNPTILTPGQHYDGMQVRGINGFTLRGNFIETTYADVEGPGGTTAAVFLHGDTGGIANVTIDGNWIDGGGYMFHIKSTCTKVRVVNNKIGRGSHWGLLYPNGVVSSQELTISSNTWWDTLEPIEPAAWGLH